MTRRSFSWLAAPTMLPTPMWWQQLYLHTCHRQQYCSSLQSSAACISGINDWMRDSRLRLNPTKTQVIWQGCVQQLGRSTSSTFQPSARHLGIAIDSHLLLLAHVAALCRSRYFQLRQLHSAVRSLQLPKHWSRRSFLAVWTTATHFCKVCLTASFGSYTQFRTPPQVSLSELYDPTTSRPCYISYNGFMSATSRVQSRMPGAPVMSIFSWQHQPCRWQWWPSTLISYRHRPMYAQHFRRQELQCFGSARVWNSLSATVYSTGN